MHATPSSRQWHYVLDTFYVYWSNVDGSQSFMCVYVLQYVIWQYTLSRFVGFCIYILTFTELTEGWSVFIVAAVGQNEATTTIRRVYLYDDKLRAGWWLSEHRARGWYACWKTMMRDGGPYSAKVACRDVLRSEMMEMLAEMQYQR